MSQHPITSSYRNNVPFSEWYDQFLEELSCIDTADTESHCRNDAPASTNPTLDPKVQKLSGDQTTWAGDPAWIDILAEDAIPLQECFPDEFVRYKSLFYDFCRKSPYHIKRSYKCGFVAPRQKKRKDGTRYSPYCYEDLLARHLDPERWLLSHPDQFPIDQPGNFWLGLRSGRKTKLGCIDFDNKDNVIGCYNTCMVASDPARPLPVLTLEHVQKLKRLYDMFPNRIWCVSSATLGLHIWEKLPSLLNHRQVEGRYRPKLRRIGLSHVEVYPSPQLSNQVLRRPFGEDYYTITDDGLISDWMDQLEHFENPSSPTFASIVSCLSKLVTREWRRYDRGNGLFLTKTSVNSVKLDQKPSLQKFVCDDMAVPAECLRELALIQKWVNAGCPEVTQDTALCSGYTCINKDSLDSIPAPQAETDGVRTGHWIESCVQWATDGLPGEDSLFPVINALARWFYFVEFFDVPQDHRIEKTSELLQHFALTKHNGFITTLNNGLEGEVESRVCRIVRRSIQTSTQQDLFLRIRDKRRLGHYAGGNFMLEPVIKGQTDSPLCSAYTCINKEIDDTPLPDSIERRLLRITKAEKMRRRDGGEYPLIRFARRLLNALWKAGGEARISRGTLSEFLGYKNPNHQLEYKHLLANHGLIYDGWENFVVQKRRSALYRIRKPVAKVFELRDSMQSKSAQSP